MPAIKVRITKGGGSVDIDTDKLPDAVYQEALAKGLELLANRKMTKITVAKLEGEQLAAAQSAAMEQAGKNVEDMYSGNIRKTSTKSAKTSGAVNTEAMRLARNLVKDAMKREGIKVSYVEASEITKAAKALIEADPSLIDQAKEAIAARDAKASQVGETLVNVAKSVPISAKKQAKAEADAAKKKTEAGLSAKQAGKVAVRAKPGKASSQPSA